MYLCFSLRNMASSASSSTQTPVATTGDITMSTLIYPCNTPSGTAGKEWRRREQKRLVKSAMIRSLFIGWAESSDTDAAIFCDPDEKLDEKVHRGGVLDSYLGWSSCIDRSHSNFAHCENLLDCTLFALLGFPCKSYEGRVLDEITQLHGALRGDFCSCMSGDCSSRDLLIWTHVDLFDKASFETAYCEELVGGYVARWYDVMERSNLPSYIPTCQGTVKVSHAFHKGDPIPDVQPVPFYAGKGQIGDATIYADSWSKYPLFAPGDGIPFPPGASSEVAGVARDPSSFIVNSSSIVASAKDLDNSMGKGKEGNAHDLLGISVVLVFCCLLLRSKERGKGHPRGTLDPDLSLASMRIPTNGQCWVHNSAFGMVISGWMLKDLARTMWTFGETPAIWARTTKTRALARVRIFGWIFVLTTTLGQAS